MAKQGTITKQYMADMDGATPTEIAAALMADHPGLFSGPEAARSRVRYYLGRNGSKNRQDAALPPVVPTECRILNMDIETAPMLAFVWGCFKQYVNPDQLLHESMVLCWAAKWLGEDEVEFNSMETDIPRWTNKLVVGAFKMLKKVVPTSKHQFLDYMMHLILFFSSSDKRVVEGMWHRFNEADIVVGHNGQAFDEKTLNARWIKHGLPPPSPFKFVDTYKMAKGIARLPRNKLESVGRYYGLGQKVEHEGFGLWVKCMCGDGEAWERMRQYNEQDVRLDEEAYILFRAWWKRHPNVALHYQDGNRRCIVCGSTAVKEDTAHQAHTAASVFPAYRCESCGWVGRGRKRLDPTAAIEDRLAHAL